MKYLHRIVFLLAGMLIVAATGCTKKGSTDDPSVVTGELWLKGRVVNSITNQAIAGARVEIAGKQAITTDASGYYRINAQGIATGNCPVKATAEGFGYGSVVAQIEGTAAIAYTIRLQPLTAPVEVAVGGAILSVTDPEALADGARTTLEIPAKAFSKTVRISLTRFTGASVPGYAPVNTLNMGTFHVTTEGLASAVAMKVVLPLPVKTTSASLPLMKYDPVAGTWQITGAEAVVDLGSNAAIAEINEGGTYSLALTGSYSEVAGTQGTVTTIKVDPAGSFVEMGYLGTNRFPDGVPAGISDRYLANVASQNTLYNGARISFTDSTFVTVSYIGTRPDSIPSTKSTSAGFYRWIPQVGMNPAQVPSKTNINGTLVNGIITKELYKGMSAYSFVHDQGGGGK